MKITMLLMAVAMGMAGSPVRAEESIPGFQHYLKQEVESLDWAVSESAGETACTDESEEAYFLRSFFLRVRPRVGFTIPALAKIEIVPEVELVWERPLPSGWKTYHP